MYNMFLPCIAEHMQQCFVSLLHGNDADLLAPSVRMSVCVMHEDESYLSVHGWCDDSWLVYTKSRVDASNVFDAQKVIVPCKHCECKLTAFCQIFLPEVFLY